jgi:iron complex outermembrane receptor protein
VAAKWENTGEITGYGMEAELEYMPTKTLKILANASAQKAKDDVQDDDVGDTPNYQFYARAEWKTNDKWLISPQINWVGSQKRSPSDTRTESVPHYTTVDLTIRQFDVVNDLDISISIRNLFDRDVYEPSLSAPIFIPGDYPMAGRSIYGELAYSF